MHDIFVECKTLLCSNETLLRAGSTAYFLALFARDDALESEMRWLTEESASGMSLIDTLLSQIRQRDTMYIDALSIVARMAKKFPVVVSTRWEEFSRLFQSGFSSTEENVRLLTVKVLVNYVKGAENQVGDELSALSCNRLRC